MASEERSSCAYRWRSGGGRRNHGGMADRQWGEAKEKNEKKVVCPGSLKLVVGSLGLEFWKIKVVFVNLLDSWYSMKWLEEKKH